MEASKDPISVRVARINSEITGKNARVKKTNVLSRETLLDVLQALYDECSLDALQKYDKNIAQFVEKYKNSMKDLKNLRVNISDFEVKNIIGRGHFGEVHIVKERQTGDVYAMKTMRKFDNDIKRISFEEERNIMAFSHSPWLTSLQYAFQDSTYLFFVMEYHPGGDLLGLLYRQGGTLPESASTFYLAELILALEDLHSMGYIHRDIKPDNILLDRCGHLKLADFGSAAKLNKNGRVNTGPPVGTPDYIAPEVLESLENKKDNPGYDISCDFWSVGVLAYELTIGNTPFQGQSTTTIYSKIMNHANSLKFPADLTLSLAYVSFIKGLITGTKSRLSQKQIKSHALFKNTNFDTLRDQVPPFVPKISSTEDTSNFSDVQSKKKNPNIENFKKRVQFSGRNLPFIGFTFTHDPDCFHDNFKKKNRNEEVVDSLQKEIEKLRKEVVKSENWEKEKVVLKKKLEEKNAKVQSLEILRDTLEKDLAGTLTESMSLKRTLDLERKDWAELEKKALELIKGAKLKWAANEKQKVDTLNLHIEQLREKISQLTNTNKLLDEQLQHALKVQVEHKQSLERVQDMGRRSVIGLENQLEKVTVETRATIVDLQKKLNEAIFEKNSLENKVVEHESKEVLLQEKLKNSKTDYVGLKKKVDEAEELVKELSKKVMCLEKDVETAEEYKKEIDVLHNQVDKNQKVIKDLENRNTLLQVEVNSLEDYKKEMAELKQKISKIQNDRKVAELESKLHEEREKVSSLRKQLEENESIVSENQELKELRVKFWRMEKEFGNCKVDKRILERELKDAQNEITQLNNKLKDTTNKIEENRKASEIALLELANINESVSLELLKVKENYKNLQQKFDNEKEKSDEEKNIIMELKGIIKSKEDKIDSLSREIESVKRAKLSLEGQNKSCDSEKKKLMNLVENLQREKNNILNELERVKKEVENKSLSLEALREACTLLEGQVIEYEKINASQQQKQQELNANTEKLISDLCKAKQEIQEAKKQVNEEKSFKLMAETKLKRVEEDVKCLQNECAAYKEKCVDYKHSMTDLSDTLTLAEEKISNLEITLKSFERQLDDKTRENNMLKEEISDHITEISKVKESNYKLNRHIHELKINKEELTQRLIELERMLNENLNFYKERELKSDATIKQQIKLIDYLQSKVDEYSHKKKTFTEVIFGSSKKENKPPCSLALNYKDLESELVKERQNNRQLQEEIYKLKAANLVDSNNVISNKIGKVERHKSEILSPRSKNVVNQIVHSPNPQKNELYRQNSQQRMQHNIPHRFDSKLCTKSTKCAQCSNQISIGRNMHVCRECDLTSHSTCSSLLPSTCGLPQGFALHYKDKVNQAEVQKKENISLENVEVKGWIKLPNKSSGWEKRYATLTSTSINIYTAPPNEPNSSLVESFELNNEHGGKVILEPLQSEIGVPVANSDLPFILKIEVAPETTCWPTKSLILMSLSAKDKDMWFTALQKIFHTEENSTFETVLKLPEDMNVNVVIDLTENIQILGTSNGLYSYYEGNLLHIEGLEEIHHISLFPQANVVLMIANAKSHLISCDLNHLINLTQCGSRSKPTIKYRPVNVNNLYGFHILGVSKFAEQPKIAVATTKQLIILEYDLDQNDFFTSRILDTAEPTSCMLFTENSLIVGADKFFEIDLNTYHAEEFLDLSDEKLRQALKCYQIGSFPLEILQISKNPKEYLVCFNEFSVFVDEYGRSSRKKEIKSTHMPVGCYFIKQYLYIVQFAAIEVIKITEESFNDSENGPESTRIELNKFSCVGRNSKGIFLQQTKEIKFFDAKKHLDVDLSLSSVSTENGSDKFSFTSSMIHSLDGNQSETENSEEPRPRKVKFSQTNL